MLDQCELAALIASLLCEAAAAPGDLLASVSALVLVAGVSLLVCPLA